MQAIQQLIADGPPDRAAIDSFLERHEFPIVEGREITFVFHGRADQVNLRHFIYGLPSVQPLRRVAETDLWYLSLEIPERSRIEYKIERVIGRDRQWLMDPLNPRTARDPYGANSVCAGQGYEPPDWALPDAESREGALEELQVPAALVEGEGRVQVYLPARFRRSRRYPLLVVHDGADYVRYAALKTVLDNLIHRLEVAPMIVALTDSRNRLEEYAADERHARFLRKQLIPALEQRYPLIRRPDARGLMGASFGAVASMFAAWSAPGYYGRLLLQSGSFAFSDIGHHRRGPVFDPVADFVNRLREAPGRFSEKVFLSCGTYESLIYENRSMFPLLQATGMDVRFVESRDGHNWENWRDRLREGLCWLYPGPLWMVYE
jgi:enterochelin esterase family protein